MARIFKRTQHTNKPLPSGQIFLGKLCTPRPQEPLPAPTTPRPTPCDCDCDCESVRATPATTQLRACKSPCRRPSAVNEEWLRPPRLCFRKQEHLGPTGAGPRDLGAFSIDKVSCAGPRKTPEARSGRARQADLVEQGHTLVCLSLVLTAQLCLPSRGHYSHVYPQRWSVLPTHPCLSTGQTRPVYSEIASGSVLVSLSLPTYLPKRCLFQGLSTTWDMFGSLGEICVYRISVYS